MTRAAVLSLANALAFCWMLGAMPPAPLLAQEGDGNPLSVDLASGRRFSGGLDPRSTGDTLWLRIGSSSAHVLRPIDWDRVVRADRAGEPVTVEELHREVAGWEPVEAMVEVPQPAVSAQGRLPQPRLVPAADRRADVPGRDARPPSIRSSSTLPPPKVRSLLAAAWAANWDGDVENDGIVVQVVPLDAEGRAATATGTLEVFLVGPRTRSFSDAPHKQGVEFDRLGSWVRAVGPEQFRGEGVQFELPYQATHPEFDSRLGSHALVSVRLTIPGSGTFQRTVDYVRIQPFSPLRDYRQLTTGRRWLAIEDTQRGKRPVASPWGSTPGR